MNRYFTKIKPFLILGLFFLLGIGGYSLKIYGDTQAATTNGMVVFTTDSTATEATSTTSNSEIETSSTSSTTTDAETSSSSSKEEATNLFMNNSSAKTYKYTFTMESEITTPTIVEETSAASSNSSIYPKTGEVTTQNVFFSFIGLLLVGVCFIAINKKRRIQKR